MAPRGGGVIFWGFMVDGVTSELLKCLPPVLDSQDLTHHDLPIMKQAASLPYLTIVCFAAVNACHSTIQLGVSNLPDLPFAGFTSHLPVSHVWRGGVHFGLIALPFKL